MELTYEERKRKELEERRRFHNRSEEENRLFMAQSIKEYHERRNHFNEYEKLILNGRAKRRTLNEAK